MSVRIIVVWEKNMEYVKNQQLELEITDMGNDGEGIGKINGYPFFVKDSFIGDRVKIIVTKVKKNYAYGKMIEILVPSEYRTEPRCPISKRCGGCQLQALSYEKQLEYKERKVYNNLVRIGGIKVDRLSEIFEPIIGMDEPYRYRNKAQYPVGRDKCGNIVAGFYASHSHEIVESMDCVLGIEENAQILKIIKDCMKKYNITPYDETKGNGIIRHVLIRKGFRTGEIMICLIVNVSENKFLSKNNEAFMHQREMINELSKIEGVKSICLNFNTTRNNVIMGDKAVTIYGEERIKDELLGNCFAISPMAFYQVNPVQTEKLYSTAIEFADLTGKEEVWDICCGIGTISLCMAGKAKFVHGIEIVPAAIEDACKNAELNKISNVEFICAAAEDYLPANRDKITADVFVLDPPRKGMEEAALDIVVKAAPERIVYVSCDSATLARDIKYLSANGYELKRVRTVDMFPQTMHVETVCLLSKLHEAKHHVSVKLDMDELDITSAESKATYEEIKKYVAEHNDGMKVSNLYIAQVKRKCGLELAENFNLPKSEDAKQPQCPKEKEDAIMEALKVFKMI